MSNVTMNVSFDISIDMVDFIKSAEILQKDAFNIEDAMNCAIPKHSLDELMTLAKMEISKAVLNTLNEFNFQTRKGE